MTKTKKATSKKSKKATSKNVAIGSIANKKLIKRAEEYGLSKEQIGKYPDENSLTQFLDAKCPKSNPVLRPEQIIAPDVPKIKEEVPDKFEIESKLENKFIVRSRLHFDEDNLQAELRRINRKYGTQSPVKIVKTMTFKPDKENKLVTKFEIFIK